MCGDEKGDKHGWDVLARKGIRCVRDQKTCLDIRGVNFSGSCLLDQRRSVSILTLPTAPSPVTTHCASPISRAFSGTEHPRRRAVHLQRLSSRTRRHGLSKYVHRKRGGDKGDSVRMAIDNGSSRRQASFRGRRRIQDRRY